MDRRNPATKGRDTRGRLTKAKTTVNLFKCIDWDTADELKRLVETAYELDFFADTTLAAGDSQSAGQCFHVSFKGDIFLADEGKSREGNVLVGKLLGCVNPVVTHIVQRTLERQLTLSVIHVCVLSGGKVSDWPFAFHEETGMSVCGVLNLSHCCECECVTSADGCNKTFACGKGNLLVLTNDIRYRLTVSATKHQSILAFFIFT